jgi:hypothetical protein
MLDNEAPPAMGELTPQQRLYADLMDEARIRIHALRDAIDARNLWVPRLLQEFAYLQLRMLCETVAIGCLIAHGDIVDRKTFKSWNAADIIQQLSKLNLDFYPHGIRIRVDGDTVHLDEYPVPQMTKQELIDLWGKSGNFLHRGSAKNLVAEQDKMLNVDLDAIIQHGQKILSLLDQHIISSTDKKRHLLVALGGGGATAGRASVWFAQSP